MNEYKLDSYRDEDGRKAVDKNKYLIDEYVDGDGVKVTHFSSSKESYISCLFTRLSERLIEGTKPDPYGAIQELQGKFPKKLEAVIQNLLNNQTEEGMMIFENSMISGFKKIGRWSG